MQTASIRAWLRVNWFYAGLTAAVFLLAIAPLLRNTWTPALILVFLQLPIYMLHQVEEHDHDRFRSFLNLRLGGGRDALTPDAVLVINIAGVWLVDLVALYLARFVHPGLGLIAVFLAIVNGLVHVLGALVFRVYNPGLVTAVALLLPAGCAAWWMLAGAGECTMFDYVLGVGTAIAIHAAIILWLRYRLGRLKHSAL